MSNATKTETPAAYALAADLLKFAKSDLATAQRDSKRSDRRGVGEMMVCKTRRGNIFVRYAAATKTYSLTTQGSFDGARVVEGVVLASGSPSKVAPVLACLYEAS